MIRQNRAPRRICPGRYTCRRKPRSEMRHRATRQDAIGGSRVGFCPAPVGPRQRVLTGRAFTRFSNPASDSGQIPQAGTPTVRSSFALPRLPHRLKPTARHGTGLHSGSSGFSRGGQAVGHTPPPSLGPEVADVSTHGSMGGGSCQRFSPSDRALTESPLQPGRSSAECSPGKFSPMVRHPSGPP